AEHLFGRHVGDRARGCSRPGQVFHAPDVELASALRWRSRLCQPKIQNLGVFLRLRRDKNIGRLDVSMNDALAVGSVEPFSDLKRVIEHRAGRKGSPRESIAERAALQQFHYDERLSSVFPDFVDSTDVWMVQRRCGAGFQTKALQSNWMTRELIRKKFESDLAPQTNVLCPVDHTHSATPNEI